MRCRFRPNHEHIGDRRVGDPHFRCRSAGSRPATFSARVFMPPGSEPASGSVSPKQPTHSPRGELRQVFPLLRLVAVGVDRIHDQRGLHAHHRAVAGIDPLDLARHKPVGHIARARAAIAPRRPSCPSSPSAPISRKICAVGLFLQVGFHDPRGRACLARSRARFRGSAARLRQAEHPGEAGPPTEMRWWNWLPSLCLPPCRSLFLKRRARLAPIRKRFAARYKLVKQRRRLEAYAVAGAHPLDIRKHAREPSPGGHRTSGRRARQDSRNR